MKYTPETYPVPTPRGDTIRAMREPNCVGALVRDRNNRVYIQRRSLQRRQLPGAWDIVGGHVEPGETTESALAREVSEETGWKLRRIEAVVADWEWTHNGSWRRELDFLVEVSGDLDSPRLEPGKHDRTYWVGYDNTDSVRTGYDAGNDVLWTIIRRATRIRLSSDLRLEPVGLGSADALRKIYTGGGAALESRALPAADVSAVAAALGESWDLGRGYCWIAYSRKAPGPALGYGGLMRTPIRGSEQLMLQCAVPPGRRQVDSAAEIVKAVLAFARNELRAESVFARVMPGNRWAREVMDQSGMEHAGVDFGKDYAELFQVNFLGASPYALDHDEVTGIGQILAVPR